MALLVDWVNNELNKMSHQQSGKIVIEEYAEGEPIIHEGEISDCAYILESGRAEVLKNLPNGEQQVVGVLEENDIFGELGLIDGFPRSATVRALETCKVSVLTQPAFNSLAKHNPQALMPILKIMAKRLRQTLEIIDERESDHKTSKSVPVGSL